MEKVLITRHLIVGRGWQFAERFFSSELAPVPSPTNDIQVKSYQQVFPSRFCGEIGVAASGCAAGSSVVSRNRRLMTTTTGLKKVVFD
jgi:hypothetical protein